MCTCVDIVRQIYVVIVMSLAVSFSGLFYFFFWFILLLFYVNLFCFVLHMIILFNLYIDIMHVLLFMFHAVC